MSYHDVDGNDCDGNGRAIPEPDFPISSNDSEGVQGKEPQTPDFADVAIQHNLCSFVQGDDGYGGEDEADPNAVELAKCAYSLGEAAGRRSAITEMQETVADWGRRSRDASFVEACDWCLKKCAELLEKTK